MGQRSQSKGESKPRAVLLEEEEEAEKLRWVDA